MDPKPNDYDAPLDACPLCRSESISPHDHDFQGRHVFRCHGCQLQFMNPQYTDDYLNRLYSEYLHDDGEDQLRAATLEDSTDRHVGKSYNIQLVQKFVKPGRFLSVGCADGLEMLLAQQMGWQVEGFDVDEKSMAELRSQIQLPIHSGDFFQLNLPSDHYDCVFLDQVLEHPKNPQDYLREIRRILTDEGVLFIGVPNISSLSCRYKTMLGKLRLKKKRGRHYDAWHHLFYYSPRALARLLESEYGFEVLTVEGTPHTGRSVATNAVALRRRFPVLEGTFCLLARKRASVALRAA